MTTTPVRRFGLRIADVVKVTGVPHDSVLKDHALSYLLAGIATVDELRASLVFKGGTALRKCYFADYRYSQDLDFSTRGEHHWSSDELLVQLRAACNIAEELTSQFGAYSFSPRVAHHRAAHPADQLDFRVDVSFPSGAQTSLKVEITQDEPILFATRELPILHAFEEERLDVPIPVYSLDEIVLEKLRGFLQVRVSLEQRGWTNRVRDLFDLHALRSGHSEYIRWDELREPLRTKAAARGVPFAGPGDFLAAAVLTEYRAQWDHRLENLVPGTLPSFEEAEATLREILSEVFGGLTVGNATDSTCTGS